MKKRVTGIGGIFFKSKDAKKLTAWYDKHLNISPLPHSPWGEDDDAPLFEWRDKDKPEKKCHTVFSIFPDDADFFDTSPNPFMLNFRVADLDAVLSELKTEGIPQIGEIGEFSFGRMVRISDPEGNLIELWEPAEGY